MSPKIKKIVNPIKAFSPKNYGTVFSFSDERATESSADGSKLSSALRDGGSSLKLDFSQIDAPQSSDAKSEMIGRVTTRDES